MDSISEAQHDMRTAYFNGIPGVVSSGSVWVVAGILATIIDAEFGIAALVIGGTLIFPLSVLLCKLLGRSGKHQKNNPLAPLAIEGTFWMLLCIPVALGAAFHRLEWFFPAMILVIGGRYLTFKTLYGLKIFWVFAGALVAAGAGLIVINAPAHVSALAGGFIELLFAALIYVFCRPEKAAPELEAST